MGLLPVKSSTVTVKVCPYNNKRTVLRAPKRPFPTTFLCRARVGLGPIFRGWPLCTKLNKPIRVPGYCGLRVQYKAVVVTAQAGIVAETRGSARACSPVISGEGGNLFFLRRRHCFCERKRLVVWPSKSGGVFERAQMRLLISTSEDAPL